MPQGKYPMTQTGFVRRRRIGHCDLEFRILHYSSSLPYEEKTPQAPLGTAQNQVLPRTAGSLMGLDFLRTRGRVGGMLAALYGDCL